MKHAHLTVTALGLSIALIGCGPKKPAAAPPAPSVAPASADMSSMPMAAGMVMAKGTGVVTAIDRTARTITLDHGPIPEANWPAMTMTFKTDPSALTDQVKVGDHVSFDVKLHDGAGTVTAIRPQ